MLSDFPLWVVQTVSSVGAWMSQFGRIVAVDSVFNMPHARGPPPKKIIEPRTCLSHSVVISLRAVPPVPSRKDAVPYAPKRVGFVPACTRNNVLILPSPTSPPPHAPPSPQLQKSFATALLPPNLVRPAHNRPTSHPSEKLSSPTTDYMQEEGTRKSHRMLFPALPTWQRAPSHLQLTRRTADRTDRHYRGQVIYVVPFDLPPSICLRGLGGDRPCFATPTFWKSSTRHQQRARAGEKTKEMEPFKRTPEYLEGEAVHHVNGIQILL